jgi:RNase P subunit RPR2
MRIHGLTVRKDRMNAHLKVHSVCCPRCLAWRVRYTNLSITSGQARWRVDCENCGITYLIGWSSTRSLQYLGPSEVSQ